MFLCRILNSFANWRKCKINKLLKNCNQRAEHETLKSGLLCLACLLLPLSKNIVILRLWLQKLILRFLYLPLQQITFSTYSKFWNHTSKTLIKNKFKSKVLREINCKNPRWRQGHGHFQLALAFIEKKTNEGPKSASKQR